MNTGIRIPFNRFALAMAAIGFAVSLSQAVMISDANGDPAPGQPATISSAGAPAASGSASGSPFAKGERVGFAMLALGGFHGSYGSTTIPPIAVGVDWGLDRNFSAGGFVGIARSTYDYGYFGSYYEWSYTYIPIVGRVSYHILDVIKDMPLDPYAALSLGYNIVTVSGPYTSNASTSYVHWGADIGARYWFKPNLAGQVELGYGLGFLSLGIAYKL